MACQMEIAELDATGASPVLRFKHGQDDRGICRCSLDRPPACSPPESNCSRLSLGAPQHFRNGGDTIKHLAPTVLTQCDHTVFLRLLENHS